MNDTHQQIAEAFSPHAWPVEKRTLYHETTFANLPIEGHRAIVRTDTETCLGIVGPQYAPWTNVDAMVLVQGIADQIAGATVEQVAEIHGGRQMIAQVKLRDWDLGGDVSRDLLTLRWSHDGSTAVQAFPSSVRFVCTNQLHRMVEVGRSRGMVSVRHTGSVKERMQDASRAIEAAYRASDQWEEVARRLRGWHLSQTEAGNLTLGLVDAIRGRLETDASKKEIEAHERTGREILIQGERYGADGAAEGTAWDLLNRATGWLQHVARTTDRVASANLPTSVQSKRKEAIVDMFAAKVTS